MPEKNPTPGPHLTRGEREFGAMERDVIYLLTEPARQPTVWSVADIGRELEYFDAEALTRPLCGKGLLHQVSDGFVIATPAAFHMADLVGHAT
jgi:hypothetical protein